MFFGLWNLKMVINPSTLPLTLSPIFSTAFTPRITRQSGTHLQTDQHRPRYPGTFENYVASIIHEWQETTDERLKR